MSRFPMSCLLVLSLAVAGCGPKLPLKATPPKVGTTAADLIGKARLMGTVRLLSGLGAGVVSNSSGGVLSDNGLGLIANNGGNVLSDNGLGVDGGGTRKLQAAQEENALAEALVEVLDAAGNPLLDAKGKALSATTNRQGAYALDAALPAGTLVLRVKLFPKGGPHAAGGELRTIVPAAAADKPREATIDTATSLAAAYVLDRYVKGQAGVLDKLPAADATALVAQLEDQRGDLQAPTYQAGELATTVQGLRAKVPALDQTLVRIEAALLAGQVGRGNGLPATQAALVRPQVLAVDGQRLLISEIGGRLRGVSLAAADAPIQRVAGGPQAASLGDGGPALDARLGGIEALARGADGSIFIVDGVAGTIRHIKPDATIETLKPKGAAAPFAHVRSLALAPDGTLLIGEAPSTFLHGRLLHMALDGSLAEEDTAALDNPAFLDLAVAKDGTIFALDARTDGQLRAKAPGQPWRAIGPALFPQHLGGLAVAPDGGVYVANTGANQVLKIGPGDKQVVVAGTGALGDAGDGGDATAATLCQPSGLALGDDGTLYVADSGNELVRAIAPGAGRTIRTVAGTRAAVANGEAKVLPMSTPIGLTLDPQGRLVVVSSLAGVIKRLEGGKLTVIAGAGPGTDGDGVDALAARFNAPSAAVYQGADLIVADTANSRIRRVGADGKVTTLVKHIGSLLQPDRRRYPASDMPLHRPLAVATGPDGLLYWTDNESCQLWRLRADGQCELLAGAPLGTPGDYGDGGPAAQALLTAPGGIVFSSDGHWLYLADTGNMRVRRIDMTDPKLPISNVAGLSREATFLRLGSDVWQAGAAANGKDTAMFLPLYLALDAKGTLFVSEAGTGYAIAAAGDKNLATYAEVLGALPLVPPRIRVIGADGLLDTLVGPGGKVYTDAKADEALGGPCPLVFDAQGQLVLGDPSQDRLEIITLDGKR
ncbi:MAG: repeat containing protein [Cyanobacteria bacterium RYN_339]|nr:repeat containing protein [Cyanobacteria bacterium RYN_339]